MKRRLLSNLKELDSSFVADSVIPTPEKFGMTRQQNRIGAELMRRAMENLTNPGSPDFVMRNLELNSLSNKMTLDAMDPEKKKKYLREWKQIQKIRSNFGVGNLSGDLSDEEKERIVSRKALDYLLLNRAKELAEAGFKVGGKDGAIPFTERDPILMSQIARQIESLNRVQQKSVYFAKRLKQPLESKLYPDTGPSSPPRSFSGGQEHGRGAQQTPVQYLPSPDLSLVQEDVARSRGAQLLNQTQLIADSQGAAQGTGRTEFNGMSIIAKVLPDGRKQILADVIEKLPAFAPPAHASEIHIKLASPEPAEPRSSSTGDCNVTVKFSEYTRLVGVTTQEVHFESHVCDPNNQALFACFTVCNCDCHQVIDILKRTEDTKYYLRVERFDNEGELISSIDYWYGGSLKRISTGYDHVWGYVHCPPEYGGNTDFDYYTYNYDNTTVTPYETGDKKAEIIARVTADVARINAACEENKRR